MNFLLCSSSMVSSFFFWMGVQSKWQYPKYHTHIPTLSFLCHKWPTLSKWHLWCHYGACIALYNWWFKKIKWNCNCCGILRNWGFRLQMFNILWIEGDDLECSRWKFSRCCWKQSTVHQWRASIVLKIQSINAVDYLGFTPSTLGLHGYQKLTCNCVRAKEVDAEARRCSFRGIFDLLPRFSTSHDLLTSQTDKSP